MYVRTAEALRQVPLLHSSFVGTLGQPRLSPESQNFLERVKRSPQDYEAVLLTSALHANPWTSSLFIILRVRGSIVSPPGWEDEKNYEKWLAIDNAMREQLLGALKGILAKHLKDKQFQRLYRKETQLSRDLTAAYLKRILELDSKMTSQGTEADLWLIKASLQGSQEAGRLFVITVLPREIVEQVLNSRVPEAHYSRIGELLLDASKIRQNQRPDFKKRVEDAQKGPPPLEERPVKNILELFRAPTGKEVWDALKRVPGTFFRPSRW